MTQQEQQQNNIQQSNTNQQTFKIHGMKHDLSESSFENNFAFENMNMRINIVDSDNTLLNLTNERGTLDTNITLTGIPIGCKKYASNKILLITTQDGNTSTKDHIYNIVINNSDLISADDLTGTGKSYGFSSQYPIEIEHFSDSEKDYFYLADGLNNFKTFWIENNTLKPSVDNIDYIKEISGEDTILYRIIKQQHGEFYSGVIVYCFCYITEQGHKTNIIDITKCIKITNHGLNHGLEPNKRTNIAINLKLLELSSNFKSVEIYSLFRSTLDGEITVRKVAKLEIKSETVPVKEIIDDYNGERILSQSDINHYYTSNTYCITTNTVTYIDENKGDIISYQELLTRFNSILIPSTICSKNNTLFLGGIKTNNYTQLKTLLSYSRSVTTKANWDSNLEDFFYSKNKYYSGVQLQDKYGNWTPVIAVGEINYKQDISLSSSFVNKAIQQGYVAARGMMIDNKRLRNSICQGIGLQTISIENGKYGIDIYAAYSQTIQNALFQSYDSTTNIITSSYPFLKAQGYEINKRNYYDLYSPDVTFNENLLIDNTINHLISWRTLTNQQITEYDPNIEITLNSNTGVLFNNGNPIGNASYEFKYTTQPEAGKCFYWEDCLEKYQEALQLQFGAEGSGHVEDIKLTPLTYLNEYGLYEKPTKFRIYVWQPSGSLNDSDGRISVLNTKKIGWYNSYICLNRASNYNNTDSKQIFTFDGTNNIIPLNLNNNLNNETITYGGIINHKLFQKTWNVEMVSNTDGNSSYFDSFNTQNLYYDYARSFLKANQFVGIPIEIKIDDDDDSNYNYFLYLINLTAHRKLSILDEITYDSSEIHPYVYSWSDDTSTELECIEWGRTNYSWRGDINETLFQNCVGSYIPVLASKQFTRKGQISITYKTNKHLIVNLGNNYDVISFLIYDNENLNNIDIEKDHWIIASNKKSLVNNQALILEVNLDDVYNWYNDLSYQALISEPYSQYDTNQVCCLAKVQGVSSYINPFARCDKFINTVDPMNLSDSFFNKINLVYNQKNNFFIFSGITSETVTDDTLENAILYSDQKITNEKEDTFVNFYTTNFYTIDSSINKINKLITYNDKILCFSDDAISQILYNENVVIDTESIQSLGLASTDKVTGSKLITNSYGCLNKWSIGIFNNDLYFIDDLNKKLISYNGEFLSLNEQLGIETLNYKFIKNKIWNPNNWASTKLNIDKFAKDVHFTTIDYDIAFNSELGSFTSAYNYEKVPFIENIGNHTIAFKYINNSTKVFYLREGNYNNFFGTYKPFWTTVIVNQNSLVNKMLSNIEFSSEAYSINNGTLIPQHNYTFSHVKFWNDYQENKVKIYYKMYGQSLLKRKFRVWRINRFRNYSRMSNRNYDMIANTWTYMQLLTEGAALEENNKLTLHWLTVNYR